VGDWLKICPRVASRVAFAFGWGVKRAIRGVERLVVEPFVTFGAVFALYRRRRG